jgi:hypothetical protein
MFQHTVHVSRPRTRVGQLGPGGDQCASAWLIRPFIDPNTTFALASCPGEQNSGIRFDMYGAGFNHEHD